MNRPAIAEWEKTFDVAELETAIDAAFDAESRAMHEEYATRDHGEKAWFHLRRRVCLERAIELIKLRDKRRAAVAAKENQ